MAIEKDRIDMVDLIMSCANVNLNLLSPIEGTPLHVASRKSNLKIVQKLVLSGADIMMIEPQKA